MGNDQHGGPAQLGAKDMPEMRARDDAHQAGLLRREEARCQGIFEMYTLWA